jgi:hypothetical protein
LVLAYSVVWKCLLSLFPTFRTTHQEQIGRDCCDLNPTRIDIDPFCLSPSLNFSLARDLNLE